MSLKKNNPKYNLIQNHTYFFIWTTIGGSLHFFNLERNSDGNYSNIKLYHSCMFVDFLLLIFTQMSADNKVR